MQIVILTIAWISITLISIIFVLSHNDKLISHRLRKCADWVYQKPVRILMIGEFDIALFSLWISFLYQTDPFISIVGSPIYHALSMFVILSIILFLYISRISRFKYPIRGALKSAEELYEAEVLAWDNYNSGLDYIISYINENESNPDEIITTILSHISSRNDELGTIARERLKDYKSNTRLG